MMEGSANVSAKVFETGLVYVAVASCVWPIPALRSTQSRSMPPRPNNLARPTFFAAVIFALSFQTAASHALDHVLLADDEDYQDGYAGHHATGHDDRVIRRVGPLEVGEPRREGEALRVEEHVEGPEEVVPIDQES